MHAPCPQLVAEDAKSSSSEPSQSSSRPLHTVSVALAGCAGRQLSTTVPPTQLVAPVAPHTPAPHVVGVEAYASSTAPSQSSSTPLHVASLPVGLPGLQLSTTWPFTHVASPVAWQLPAPHTVEWVANSSSILPSQSSSTPSQVSSRSSVGVHAGGPPSAPHAFAVRGTQKPVNTAQRSAETQSLSFVQNLREAFVRSHSFASSVSQASMSPPPIAMSSELPPAIKS